MISTPVDIRNTRVVLMVLVACVAGEVTRPSVFTFAGNIASCHCNQTQRKYEYYKCSHVCLFGSLASHILRMGVMCMNRCAGAKSNVETEICGFTTSASQFLKWVLKLLLQTPSCMSDLPDPYLLSLTPGCLERSFRVWSKQ